MVATIVGLLGGVFGFYKFYEQKRQEISDRLKSEDAREKAEQAARNDEWLQAAVHQVMQNCGPDGVSFGTIRTEIAGSAFFDKTVAFDRSDLDDVELRRLIVKMISLGVVDQTGDDHYAPRLKVLSDQERAHQILMKNTDALPIVETALKSGPLTLTEVRAKLRDQGIELGRAQLAGVMAQMSAMSLIQLVEEQNISTEVPRLYWRSLQ